MKKAIFAGSFDPITLGHLNLIERATRLFDQLILVIAVNPSKQTLFSLQERQKMVKKAIQELPDFVVGIKARMSRTVIGDNGITPLELAKQIQQENQEIPLMVHIGSAPPHLDEILALMEKGDVLTHCFNGKENGILDQATDKIKDFAP